MKDWDDLLWLHEIKLFLSISVIFLWFSRLDFVLLLTIHRKETMQTIRNIHRATRFLVLIPNVATFKVKLGGDCCLWMSTKNPQIGFQKWGQNKSAPERIELQVGNSFMSKETLNYTFSKNILSVKGVQTLALCDLSVVKKSAFVQIIHRLPRLSMRFVQYSVRKESAPKHCRKMSQATDLKAWLFFSCSTLCIESKFEENIQNLQFSSIQASFK